MEASEKHQLPLDGGSGSVRALGDRLVIESLTVADERVARVVRERAEAGYDPARTVADAIVVGARVLDRAGTEVEADYVRRELERQGFQLGERLARQLEAGEGRLAERIASSFDGTREGSVQQQIKALLARALEEQRTALTRQFTTEDGVNPLSDFKGAVVRALRQTDERHHKEAEETRRSHARESHQGREQIAALRREVGELKERLGAGERIAEVEEAGTRKGRSFEERVPSGREPLREYGGNKMIVAVDREEPAGLPLEVAYRLASARVLMARDRSLTVDSAGVRHEADAALAALKEAQKIRGALTGAGKSIESARGALDAMVELVRSHLERIEELGRRRRRRSLGQEQLVLGRGALGTNAERVGPRLGVRARRDLVLAFAEVELAAADRAGADPREAQRPAGRPILGARRAECLLERELDIVGRLVGDREGHDPRSEGARLHGDIPLVHPHRYLDRGWRAKLVLALLRAAAGRREGERTIPDQKRSASPPHRLGNVSERAGIERQSSRRVRTRSWLGPTVGRPTAVRRVAAS